MRGPAKQLASRPPLALRSRAPVGGFRENTILVQRAANPDGSSKPTKNRKHRTVRLPSALAQDVREYKFAIGRPPEQTLILLHDDGKPWDKNAWQMWHAAGGAPACRAVGLDPVPRPYDLRHSPPRQQRSSRRPPAHEFGHARRRVQTAEPRLERSRPALAPGATGLTHMIAHCPSVADRGAGPWTRDPPTSPVPGRRSSTPRPAAVPDTCDRRFGSSRAPGSRGSGTSVSCARRRAEPGTTGVKPRYAALESRDDQ